VDRDRALSLLAEGEMEIVGLLPMASNATLLTTVDDGELCAHAVYKPQRGERPLWDFPDGTLCLREQAAWVVDDELGWGLVPPTVLREGPAGLGALQLYVDHDSDADLQAYLDEHPGELARLALFDHVINNADRKGGHCLLDPDGRLWGVDHGVTFHTEPKVRTVIWAFASDPIPDALLADLEAFHDRGAGSDRLAELLTQAEIDALLDRVRTLIVTRRFPLPGPGPQVPWPPW